ncbi:S-formylglutathione hydrolase isoform X1 [Battus philenor]|uniref:S-formylglutathione hydrolase isoform X1 n=2 Tax=Battus philenor TaxID=42288 RepID=UPI0035D13352
MLHIDLDLKNKLKMDSLELVSSNKIFGGLQKVYSHESSELKCKMNFSIYLPPQADGGDVKLPVIFYLSGLTCTEQNFITKSGFQRYAAEHGIIVVGPDTSPRGVKVPGDDDSWDFGVSAGFYLDASKDPWSNNYRMGSYLNKELYELIQKAFNNVVDPNRIGIMGHSMGGHGALVSTLRNPGLYKSVSAFSPICNPSACPWGIKAFTGYLGEDKKTWEEWDATELVKKYEGPPVTLFLDQGAADKFYIEKQLLPENLVDACRSAGVPVILNLREGYDHSYYYISTYIAEHFDFHAKILKA